MLEKIQFRTVGLLQTADGVPFLWYQGSTGTTPSAEVHGLYRGCGDFGPQTERVRKDKAFTKGQAREVH